MHYQLVTPTMFNLARAIQLAFLTFTGHQLGCDVIPSSESNFRGKMEASVSHMYCTSVTLRETTHHAVGGQYCLFKILQMLYLNEQQNYDLEEAKISAFKVFKCFRK